MAGLCTKCKKEPKRGVAGRGRRGAVSDVLGSRVQRELLGLHGPTGCPQPGGASALRRRPDADRLMKDSVSLTRNDLLIAAEAAAHWPKGLDGSNNFVHVNGQGRDLTRRERDWFDGYNNGEAVPVEVPG